MAGSLPLVRGGLAQALCPVTRRVEFLTDVAIGLNATEQRFKRRPPLTRFVLPYTRMNAADTLAMKTFFETQRGTFDSTWSFTLGATTYSHLTFEDDTFTIREEDATRTTYSFTLRARQTQNPPPPPSPPPPPVAGDPGAPFPTLAKGNVAMLPYQKMRRYAVLLNDNAAVGTRYSYVWLSSSDPTQGPFGFPTGALRGWVLEYPELTDADTATIETHFRNQWGRWSRFSFTDPDDNAVFPKCRYDDDALEIVNLGPNQNSLTLRILETN